VLTSESASHDAGGCSSSRAQALRDTLTMPNAYNAGMIASLLVLAIGFGVVFVSTRSLVPSVVAHAILNVPMTPFWPGT
jgi:Type II CAAX prenyl endopeptidase Rce1-like